MEAFDETDFRILREMWAGPHYFRVDRVSLEELGRAVGLHRSSVAARLAKWARTGFLERVSADVDPTTIGLVGAHVQLHARAQPRDAALDEALAVGGVAIALLFDHDWLGFPIFADSPDTLAATVAELARILDADEVVEVSNTERDFPDAKRVPLTALDARIIQALRRDGRAMPSAIADALDVSTRTVERRLQRLRDEGVVYTLPVTAMDRAAGVTVGLLHFPLPAEGRARALQEALARAPQVIVRQTEAPTVARLLVYAPTPAQLDATARAVAGVPGIGRATLRVMLGSRDSPTIDAWLQERIERHVARST